jgi:outer membrane receptor protein involved in Fe transport
MRKSFITLILAAVTISLAMGQAPRDTLEIEEVVISASRTKISRRNVPVTVSTLSREQIERSNESAVLTVMSHRIPGMFVTERGVTGFGIGSGSAGQISMRGVGGTAPNTQVLVLIDGHPQMQGMFAHPFPDAYVSSDVERVEVIRGPASILYGSNAMAGAVNIITRQQTREGFSGNARVSYGSFNTQKYMASGGLKEGKFSLFASINHERTDGHRDTSDFRIVNGFIKAGYQLNKNFRVSADFSIADFTSEDPGTIYDPAFFGIEIMRGRASVAIKNQFQNLEGGLIGFYNFGNHEFTSGWISEDYHAGLGLFQGFSPFLGSQITLGADYKKVAGIANNVPPLAADIWHEVDDMAAYAFMQQSLFNKLILSAGLRLENNTLFGTETVPQGGFSFIANEILTIKGSVSKGFRSPSVMELFLFAPNPALKPERIWNYELGTNYMSTNKRFRADFTVFLLDGDNMIEVVPPPPPPAMRQNVGSFTNRGIEAELSWMATPEWGFSGNYSYIHMDAPRIAAPKHQLFVESTFRKQNFRASLTARHISDLYTVVGNEPVMESFTLVNMMASCQINNFLEVFASGKNLLNKEYTINYGYPMPEINFMTGVNVSF